MNNVRFTSTLIYNLNLYSSLYLSGDFIDGTYLLFSKAHIIS
jgi:hypothetical protein